MGLNDMISAIRHEASKPSPVTLTVVEIKMFLGLGFLGMSPGTGRVSVGGGQTPLFLEVPPGSLYETL